MKQFKYEVNFYGKDRILITTETCMHVIPDDQDEADARDAVEGIAKNLVRAKIGAEDFDMRLI